MCLSHDKRLNKLRVHALSSLPVLVERCERMPDIVLVLDFKNLMNFKRIFLVSADSEQERLVI